MAVGTKRPGYSETGMSWPDDFLEPGADLSLRLLHEFVADTLVSLQDVTATVTSLRRSSQVGPNLRVAVEGGYRQDVRQQVIDSDPAYDGEPLEQWAERLFGAKPFYVVINELEVFNPALAARVARLLWPIIEAQAEWFGGLSLALLIGRQGFTSFGAHRDSGCRWNLQFHLGPAAKSMTVWDDEALAGASNADLLAVEPLPPGRELVLEAGDLFVLPCRKLHAAHYTELAVTLVASLQIGTARALAEGALRRALEEHERRDAVQEIGLSRSHSGTAAFARWTMDGSTLELAVETERLRRWSNLGMKVKVVDALPSPPELLGVTLSIVRPFPICQQELPDGRRRIVARGHTITVADDEQIGALIERLNAGEPVRVTRALPPAALMLCAFLLGHDAVYELPEDR